MGGVKPAALTPPALLTVEQDCSQFVCAHDSLTEWLKQRARNNQVSGASKTYVVCDASAQVVGYYCLAAGALEARVAPGSIRRNQPNPIPVVVLGRLAVHLDWSGHGIGSGMLKDAVLRSIEAGRIVGARALLCHAIDEQAKGFYLHHGFVASPSEPLTVMLSLLT
jgi:GNAT superfamily N-acetyltransferase